MHPLDGVPDAVAVAMIGTGRTAIGILDVAAIGADDVVLVSAAAGGIGRCSCRRRARRRSVVGAAGGRRRWQRVRELGARAVDYAEPDWGETVRQALDGREVTVALDGVGGDRGRAALELLGPGGRLIVSASPRVAHAALDRRPVLARPDGLGAIGPHIQRRPGGMRGLEEEALAAAADGRLQPVVAALPARPRGRGARRDRVTRDGRQDGAPAGTALRECERLRATWQSR